MKQYTQQDQNYSKILLHNQKVFIQIKVWVFNFVSACIAKTGAFRQSNELVQSNHFYLN